MALLASALSLLSGLALGLLGGGGSILTVPILVYVVGMDPHSAVASSMVVVGTTSAAGALLHARAGRVRLKEGLTFAVAGTASAVAGSQLGRMVSSSLLLLAFGSMVLAAALAMMRKQTNPSPSVTLSPLRRTLGLARDGLSVGALTGLVGAGGGFLVVPALSLLAGLPMTDAVGTSLLVIALNSAAGFAGTRFHGVPVDWAVTFGMSVCAVLGSLVGVRLWRGFSPHNIRRAFGAFIAGVGLLIMGNELRAMLPLPIAATLLGMAAGGTFWLSLRALRPSKRLGPAPVLSGQPVSVEAPPSAKRSP